MSPGPRQCDVGENHDWRRALALDCGPARKVLFHGGVYQNRGWILGYMW